MTVQSFMKKFPPSLPCQSVRPDPTQRLRLIKLWRGRASGVKSGPDWWTESWALSGSVSLSGSYRAARLVHSTFELW